MKKSLNVLLIVGVAVAALAIGFCTYIYIEDVLSFPHSHPAPALSSLPTEDLTIGAVHLTVEVATTAAEQELGLSYRQSLAPEAGMLFVFDTPSRQGFWMKGMNFPLDFIYRRAGHVVQLKENVSATGLPVPFFPDEDIDGVIEVNAGWISRHGIKVGDEIADSSVPAGDEPVVSELPPEAVLTNDVVPPDTYSSFSIAKEKSLPQFVTLAFDGSRSIQMWKDTLDFAKQSAAAGAPIHFTYFISGVYLLPVARQTEYLPPANPPGTSKIGFADSAKDVATRVGEMNQAIAAGHEIGSHANGHFTGTAWSLADWQQELGQFATLVKGVALNLPPGGIVGFRAPELGRNGFMYQALAAAGYRYDTSGVSLHPDAWPVKKNSLWLFPLAKIPYAGVEQNGTLLTMDYNFYFRQTNAVDTLKKGTPEWQKAYDEVLTSYRAYFEKNYSTTRAPVTIGDHFSTWNDGLYWEAMKQFASEECGKPDVRCSTFSELADYLDQHPHP